MSKKKGLSIEEKRSRMMDFFFEKKDFFQLKELERMLQKEKGITSMSVKDILTSLVDDGMVDTDKIGTSVYFWAFPSKASQKCTSKIGELEGKQEELLGRKKALRDQIHQASMGKENDAQRSEILAKLCAAEEERKRFNQELEKYKECDPEVLESIKQEAKVAKEAANRWTDNIYSTKSWIKKKFTFEEKVIDKQFGIPEDFDYVE